MLVTLKKILQKAKVNSEDIVVPVPALPLSVSHTDLATQQEDPSVQELIFAIVSCPRSLRPFSSFADSLCWPVTPIEGWESICADSDV